jgi:dihydroxyacid dehydratase/phosphogluconate dehydratase
MDARTNLKSTLPSGHVTLGAERAEASTEVFKKTPCIAGLNPGGRYVAKDLFEIGGVPLVTCPCGTAEKISYADQ